MSIAMRRGCGWCAAAAVAAIIASTATPVAAQSGAEDYDFAEPDSGGLTTQFGMQLLVPVWLRESDLHPGFGLQMRLGWEMGAFAPEFYVGGMVNWVDVDFNQWHSPSEPLDTMWIGFGTRYHVLNRSAFVPFVGVGAQVNLWGAMLWEDAYAVDDRYRPTLGAKATLGVIMELSRHFGIEVGVDGVVTTKSNVFSRAPLYLAPFVGGTGYF